ncbi:MAG TPA: nucleotide exchange factor GrpE [Methanoregulaceae archaeon]|nr:nucleotide exchange factor GrpE [Methanoregulaceae archaeon]
MIRLKGGSTVEDIEQLKLELEEQTRLAEERLNQLKYLQADFDNFRRWSAKEKDVITTLANEKLICDLLVILDDFERALPSLEQEKNRQGMEMIYKKLVKILSEYGLQPIECVGKKFDPRYHEVLCTEKCAKEQNTIMEDFGKGYRLKSKVIRPSKVKIAEHVAGVEGENNG